LIILHKRFPHPYATMRQELMAPILHLIALTHLQSSFLLLLMSPTSSRTRLLHLSRSHTLLLESRRAIMLSSPSRRVMEPAHSRIPTFTHKKLHFLLPICIYTVTDSEIMLVSAVPTFVGSNIIPETWDISLLDSNSNGILDTYFPPHFVLVILLTSIPGLHSLVR
jgi:hypothetical protein